MIGDSSDVRKVFDETLVEKFKAQPDVLKFLIDHERKKVCLDNLCAEIIKMNGRRLLINIVDFKDVIKSVAGMFAHQALRKAEQDALSDLERIRLKVEASRLSTARDVINDLKKEGALKGFDD